MLDNVTDIIESLKWVYPETALAIGFLAVLLAGMLRARDIILVPLAIGVLATSAYITAFGFFNDSPLLFGMLKKDALASFIKILINIAAIFTCVLSARSVKEHRSEYYCFMLAVVFGCHLLIMTSNFLLIFITFEIISIGSYVLSAYAFDKKGAEGSLKYFLFGSAASSTMLYGFTLLYGLTGSIDFGSESFLRAVISSQDALFQFAALAIFIGILFKASMAPMHFWAPDVYDAAPVPVVAFLSTVPKLAGLTLLFKFFLAINLFGQSEVGWQSYVVIIAVITITVGNFAALKQKTVKRMMAYSSIAQSGFLMIGLIVSMPEGLHFFLFYATAYVVMNFLVFVYVNSFEKSGITTIADYAGLGRPFVLANFGILIGMISLTGLPPTAGFTGKLLLFSSVWSAFQQSGDSIFAMLLIFGLLNTVVALFYYLRLPYFAFFKSGKPAISHNILLFENLLGVFLVLVLLTMFFQPGLLMSWINKINFVL